MTKHRHDFINRKCIICGAGQWRCSTCGHWLEQGEHCYLPLCVDDRIKAARSMGRHDLQNEHGMPDATGTS